MKLKQKPEDFTVTESWRFNSVPKGEYRVYAMDKQKLSTFDAIDRIAQRFELSRKLFSFCGLKDKQGRTRQLIAIQGAEVDLQDDDLRLEFLGRTDKPLSAENTTSNRFGVTIRDLDEAEIERLPESIAQINRLGVVNYFDSQRFGSLKHGQGFIAKDLLRGDFEAALKNYLAKPSELDKTSDAKVKAFWRDHWGKWRLRCTIPGAQKYERIIQVLKKKPDAFREAFLQIDPKYRALQIFAYQSWLWNEGVRKLLVALLPGQSLIALPYQAGKLLFPRDVPTELINKFRKMTFPIVSPETKLDDPDIRQAMTWVLGREKLSLDKLVIPNTPEIFFRHEDRPILVYPGKLMLGPARPDELQRGRKKIYVAFTLHPGSYATLVVRRLFFYSPQNNTHEEETISKIVAKPTNTSESKVGFRAQQKKRKEMKALARSQSQAKGSRQKK